MHPYASYNISLIGTHYEIKGAVDCIADVICDQDDTLPNLLDRFYSSEEDDDDDDEALSSAFEETVEIWQTHDCVWIEDIEKLAIEIATSVPGLQFSISGHIEDTSENAGDEMDFKITYKNKKLYLQSTDWYQYIHMDDFRTYSVFAKRFCDQDGLPRYSKEDFDSFKECADEWYVLDGGHGEFSSTAPLCDPVRIKI